MLAGDWYVATDPESERLHRRAMRLAEDYYRAELAADPTSRRILEDLLGHVGEGAYVQPPLVLDYGEHVSIGARTFINYHLTALDVAPITIGEDCQIGPHVQLLTPIHPIAPQPRRDKLEAAKPIVIGDNVWIGGGAIVCPGVTIGDDAVIGAGSVVTRDIPPRVVAVGNPARVLRTIEHPDDLD